ADDINDPAARLGTQLVKFSKVNGSIIDQKSFMLYDNTAATIPNRAKLQKINYDTASNQILLFFEDLGFGIHKHKFVLLDSNFNILKVAAYSNSVPLLSTEKVNISKTNIITITYPSQNVFPPDSFAYVSISNNIELIAQKKISLTNLGFPHRNFKVDLSYKKNGLLNFQLSTFTNLAQDYLYLYDNSPFYSGISPCLGNDTSIFSKVPVFAFPVTNPLIEQNGSTLLSVTDQVPGYPPIDLSLPKEEVCKQISICDTIKLFGTPYHCLSNPLDSFKIIRNPLCRRKTNWQVDTTAIKIISQTDTTLQVKYLQAYRGSIKVGFGGCSLTDSMAIEVYAPKTAVSLGKDTMLCPGKTITLYAGAGFTNYQWQDGSTADSLVIAQTGNYIITATDSCGNVFKDTITVTPLDVALNVDYPPGLCLNDTAVFNLPAPLYNFTWQPNTASLLTNNLWKLYPTVTTVYSISAEREPGCILSDTVLITIKNCPDYIYFPNAFTPNKDGLNDVYKPTVSGRIILYEFSIYNRYGQPVFKSNTPNQGWNGNFNNSQKPLPGGYVWHCRYQFINQPLVQKKGMFILIR
ncbi:MAG: gliding motility-associated C-terminal domain-containing protein, partial [Ferruginibacter sp.]